MNTFNNVFLAVKKYCNAGGAEVPEDCFSYIAYYADVPVEKLDFYLNTLQDLGLIKYSWKAKTIHLTGFGKMQERLFG